jgi:hypothetical protein
MRSSQKLPRVSLLQTLPGADDEFVGPEITDERWFGTGIGIAVAKGITRVARRWTTHWQRSEPTGNCEAAQRPAMRSKTEEKQAAGVLFQVRDLLVRQRSRINILLHGHSVELNVMGSRGGQSALKLIRLLVDVEAS